VSISTTESRVADGAKVVIVVERLVWRAVSLRAGNGLTIGASESGGDVDWKRISVINSGSTQIPEDALSTPLRAVVSIAKLGQ
jgi:hypothetical protein